MIGVQRGLKAEGRITGAFDPQLGKYERQHYIESTQICAREQSGNCRKESAFVDLILKAYRAEKVENFACFNGKRAGRLRRGSVNLPVTRLFVEEIILSAAEADNQVDILGFEFEMGLFPNVLDEARSRHDIAPKYIPAEVLDKRAVEKNRSFMPKCHRSEAHR